MDGRDVRMVQRGQQLGLALEACQPFGISGEGVGEDLDRDLAVEVRVESLPHDTHAAFADLFDEPVVEQLLAGCDGHGAGVYPGPEVGGAA